MKIKEFSITRYGPLPDSGRVHLNDFNLIWGGNEYGKTLTIDALVKILLGKNKDFNMINRVKEIPEGYVVLDDSKGGEVKLPEGGTLPELADMNASECRNIFIVINSDLSIARDTLRDPARESDFYTSVTDRLTGLRTAEISEIKETLRKVGKITATGIFTNVEGEKLKTRIKGAENLIKDIVTLVDEINENGFDEFEQESASLKEEIDRIEKELQSLENARKREKYEKTKGALDELRSALERFESLDGYNEDDEQLWRDCKKEIQDYTRKKEELSLEFSDTKKEFKEITEESSKLERDFQVLDDRKRRLVVEIWPKLENYKSRDKKSVKQKEEKGFVSFIVVFSAVMFGLCLLGMSINPSLLFYILAAVFLIPFVVSVIVKYQNVRRKGLLAEEFVNINMALSQFGLDAGDLPGVILNKQQFEEEYRKKNNQLQEIKNKKENMGKNLSDIQEKRLPEVEEYIKKAENKIAELKIKSKEESLQSYTGKLKLKLEIEGLIERDKSILATHFNKKDDNLEKNISYWNKEIRGLESYGDKAKDKEYNESFSVELTRKKREIGEKYEEINKRLKTTRDELKNIERRANDILLLRLEDDYMLCETSVDLKAVKDKLGRFIEESNKNREDVLEIISIFEEIETEEKEKVSELFGKESSVSKYFDEITGGFYDEVIFNSETDAIEVRRKDGKLLDVNKLSGGAYDQLYFSIRVALGEKLLKGKKGFFIMDDPFIKADPERLRRQMDTLMNISRRGWQIIYFSSKGEVKTILERDIKNGAINYIEIEGMFS